MDNSEDWPYSTASLGWPLTLKKIFFCFYNQTRQTLCNQRIWKPNCCISFLCWEGLYDHPVVMYCKNVIIAGRWFPKLFLIAVHADSGALAQNHQFCGAKLVGQHHVPFHEKSLAWVGDLLVPLWIVTLVLVAVCHYSFVPIKGIGMKFLSWHCS